MFENKVPSKIFDSVRDELTWVGIFNVVRLVVKIREVLMGWVCGMIGESNRDLQSLEQKMWNRLFKKEKNLTHVKIWCRIISGCTRPREMKTG
jgi:hypothetical protein